MMKLKINKTLTKKIEIKKDWNEKYNTWRIVIEWLNWKQTWIL
jgi:hypothetical protein